MTELEKMLAGEMHDITDPEVSRLNREARRKLEKLNATSWLDTVRYAEALTELIPDRAPSSVLITPFFCDYGFRIRLGEKVYINANCTCHDEGGITVGAHTLIGPDCKLYTPIHPMDAAERRKPIERGAAIEIGEDCWLGGGVVVCPGVKIGDRCIIGAGSVVTRDIPDDSLAAGNPAAVKRKLR